MQSALAPAAADAPLATVSAASVAAATTSDTAAVEATIPYGEDTCMAWPTAEATAAASTLAAERTAGNQSGTSIQAKDVPAATSAGTLRTSTQQQRERSMAAMPPPLPPTRNATAEPQHRALSAQARSAEERPHRPTVAQAALPPAAPVANTAAASPEVPRAAAAAVTAAPARRRLIGKQPVAHQDAGRKAADTSGKRGRPPVPTPAANAAPKAKVGSRVKVHGDGWGGGSGEYVASVTEVDEMTFTLVFKSGATWEETCVLREHCTLLQQEARGVGKRART